MNNGEFLKAYDQFSQLGDYLDSAACLTKAKWGLLYQYVQENGAYSAKTGKNAISQKIKSSDSKADYTMYLSMPDSDRVSLSSTYSTSDSGYTITRDFSINLEYGNTEAEWNCSLVIKISVLGVTGERLEDGSGEVDISTFKSSTSMKLSSYSGTNKSIQGVKSTISKSDEAVTSAANKALVEIKSNLVSLLKGTDIGITVEELGF